MRTNDYFRVACPKTGRRIDYDTDSTISTADMYGIVYLTDNGAQANQCISDGKCFLSYICLLSIVLIYFYLLYLILWETCYLVLVLINFDYEQLVL